MNLTALQLQTIAAAGGGLIIEAATLTALQLQTIASATANGGGQLTITNTGVLTPLQLQTIAAAGRGKVVFDLTR